VRATRNSMALLIAPLQKGRGPFPRLAKKTAPGCGQARGDRASLGDTARRLRDHTPRGRVVN
jgi:hypothetical protein